MGLLRLILLPFAVAIMIIWCVIMIVWYGLAWVFTGDAYTIKVTYNRS